MKAGANASEIDESLEWYFPVPVVVIILIVPLTAVVLYWSFRLTGWKRSICSGPRGEQKVPATY